MIQKVKGIRNQFRIALVMHTFALMTLVSCSDSVLFDEATTVNSKGWSAAEKPTYNFFVEDSVSTYRIYMHVRNHIDYRFSNLYVFMQTRFPNGNITRDTIECILADPSGKWLGTGSGQFRDHLIMLNPSIKFPLNGEYQVELEQAMRSAPLNGINAVGLRIEKNSR